MDKFTLAKKTAEFIATHFVKDEFLDERGLLEPYRVSQIAACIESTLMEFENTLRIEKCEW